MTNKFSLVSYLDDESTAIVRQLQTELYQLTGSRACLDEWQPHVTVGDGVEAGSDQLTQLRTALTEAADNQQPFSVTAHEVGGVTDRAGGKGEQTTPYALWLEVVVNDQLAELQRSLQAITNDYDQWYQMPRPYLPHITLAFRDLDEAGYLAGQDFLRDKNLQLTPTLDHIALVEKRPDSDVEFARFEFSS